MRLCPMSPLFKTLTNHTDPIPFFGGGAGVGGRNAQSPVRAKFRCRAIAHRVCTV